MRVKVGNRRFGLLLLTLLVPFGLWLLVMSSASAESSLEPGDIVEASWEKAREAGAYHFSSDIAQVTIPAATIRNVGNSSQEDRFYLEGQTDLRSQEMQMQLLSDSTGGGSLLIPESGIQIESVDGVTWARQGNGDWETIDSFAEGFAPQGDFLAYLAAASDVTELEEEVRRKIRFRRFGFDVDGPAFASYLRDQMQAVLRARGELPPKADLGPSEYYADMRGTGELWIGDDGLPIRQVLDLRFPEQDGERLDVQIRVDFSEFAEPAGQLAFLGDGQQVLAATKTASKSLLTAAVALIFAGGLIFMRRSRAIGATLAFTIISSMLFSPLLEATGLGNFARAQAAEAAKREQTKAEQDYAESVRQEMTTTTFDPLADPLQQDPVEPPPAPPPTLPPDLLQSLVEPPGESATVGDWQQAELGSALSLLSAQGNCPDPGHSDCDGLSDEFELELGTVITLTDTDGDGLDDFQELTLGTVPYNRDTDGDLLWDGVEVSGYSFGGDTWRSDPRQLDSNRDGISDAVESGPDANDDGVPDTLYDTDGDGQPDMFDEDNDNDGVPDEFDASPLKKGGAFYEANPLELVVDDLTPGEPSKIDFQLRPLNADHLWYAFNVLDWPEDDGGQVRDVDNATFQDVFKRDGYTPPESLSHGDLRLTPMLEIEVMGLANNLLSQDDLIPYNITLTDITVDGTRDTAVIGQRAYVPLSLVTDRSGARLAFAAQLPLMPDAHWGPAYEIRMVWTVEMLLDYCLEYGTQPHNQGECIDELNNQLMPIHTYDDPFVLTGLHVQEEQGVETAIIYEDPSDAPPEDDPDLHHNELLWALADAFDGTFLTARYITGTTQLDLGLDEIARRFDHRTNHDGDNDPTLEQRWNLPNYLVVERTAEDDYDTIDQATASITMTRTGQILDSAFSPHYSPGNPITPTLMFAQEHLYRGVSLDQLDSDTGQAVMAGNRLTIDFAPGPGGVALYPERLRSLKWAAYCGEQTGETEWNECPAEDYWPELERRFGQSIAEPGDTPEMTLGRQLILQNFWTILMRGVNSIVESEDVVMASSIWDPLSDKSLSQTLAKGGSSVVKGLIDGPLSQFSKSDALEAVGYKFASKVDRANAVKNFGKDRASSLGLIKLLWEKADYKIVNGTFKESGAVRKTAIRAGVVLVLAGIVFSQAARVAWPDSPEAVMAGRLVMVVVMVILEVVLPIVSTLQWATTLVSEGVAATKGAALWKMARGKSIMIKNSARANIAGAKFLVVVIWGFFLYTVISEGVAVGSPEFNQSFAKMLALTMVVLLLAVIASNPVGLFIGVVLALFDAFFAAYCAVKGEKNCFSVTETIVEFLAKVLYSYELMIEVDRKKNPDLTQIGAASVTLDDREEGYTAGASLNVSVPVTTSIRHRLPDSGDWKIQEYLHLFSSRNLRSSTFNYTLSSAQQGAQPLNVERYQMSADWQGVTPFYYYRGQPLYQGFAADQPGFGVTLSQAGLNQSIDYYFNSAYAIPAYECWLLGFILPIPVCYVRTKEGNSSTLTPGPERDIFPATIDGFMARVESGEDGYRLAWDDHFTTLWDADGDGLISIERGGIDPDDGRWDTDGDWLPDTYELEQGFDGIAYSPLSPDSDGDGLIDSQEKEFGTSPNRYDTDLDGLSDGQEVYHRVYALNTSTNRMEPTDAFTGGLQIRIAPFGEPLTTTNPSPNTYTVIVSSDPTERDPDGDSVPDDAEYLLNERGVRDPNGHAYNPNVYNEPPLQVYVAADSGGLYIAPGQQVNYTTTVMALADFEPGVVEVTAPEAMGLLGPQTYAMPAMTAVTSQTFGTAYSVQASASTQTVTLQSLATASLAADPGSLDWRWHSYGLPLPLGTGLGDYRGVNSVPSRPDSARDYLLSSLNSTATGRGGRGDIHAFSVELDSNSVITSALDTDGDDLLARRSQAAPDVVCNAAGKCLTVWDDADNCNRFTLSWLAVENDSDSYAGEAQGLEMFLTWTPDGSLGSGPSNDPPGAEESLWRYDTWNPPYVNQLAGATITEGISGLTREFCAPESADGAQLKVYEYDAAYGQTYGELIGTLELLSENMGGYAIRLGPSAEGARVQVGYSATPKQRNVLKAAITDGNGQPSQGEISLPISQAHGATTGDFFPAVATDGQNFLVAWNHKVVDDSNPASGSVTSYVQTQLYDADGVAIGTPQSYSALYSDLETFAPGSDPFFKYELGFTHSQSHVVPNVIWAGDRYRLIWSAIESGIDTRLEMVDVASSGVPDLASHESVTTNAHRSGQGPSGPPQLAYAPGTGLVRVAYTDSSSVLTTKMYHKASGALIDTRTYDTGGNYASMPSIAYYPLTDGWILSWYEPSADLLKVAALRLDGLEMLGRPPAISISDLSSARGRPLSCPAITTEPFIRWALEELPGSTLFNSTGSGNYATCSGDACPRAGAGGAGEVVFPYSDRALYFDGQDDRIDLQSTTGQMSHDFSIAFWVKTDGPTTGNWLSDSNVLVRSDGATGFGIGVGTGGAIKIGVGAQVASAGSIGDGGWHHVAVTRNSNNGVVYLWIDGAYAGGWTFSAIGSLGDDHGLTLGNVSGSPAFRGWMDEVLAYEAVLQSDSLQEILNRTRDHSCLLSAVADAGIRTYRFGLDQVDNRTGAIQAGAGLSLRIDADPPATTVGTAAPIYFKAPPDGSVTQIIGGESRDDESGVVQVEISVDGGLPEQVNGTGTWTYALLTQAGVTTVQANGTDAVGNVETTGQIQKVIGDALPPTVSFASLPVNTFPLRSIDGDWTVAIDGNADDPTIEGLPGSGVNRGLIEIQLEAEDGTVFPWQRAEGATNPWHIDYVVPLGFGDPTGQYTMTVRLEDNVGNAAEYVETISAHLPKVSAKVGYDDAQIDVITQTVSIDGVISSTVGIASVDAAFVPIEQIAVLSGTTMILNLDEPANSVRFEDSSPLSNNGICTDGCPVAGTAGAINTGITLDGSTGRVAVPHAPGISFADDQSFSFQAWIKTTAVNETVFSKYADDFSKGIYLYINDSGVLELSTGGTKIITDNASTNDGEWNLVTVAIDRETNEARLYVGTLEKQFAPLSGSTANEGPLVIGGWQDYGDFTGSIDEVMVWNRALTRSDVLATAAMRDLNWRSASLTGETVTPLSQGRELTTADWHINVADQIEGFHRLDLRMTDDFGRIWQMPSDWSAIVDTLAPRVTITAIVSERTWQDPASGQPRYDIEYTFEAEDLHLDLESFATACDEIAQPAREYLDRELNTWVDDIFPDSTWRTGLSYNCHGWSEQANPTVQIDVCDIYGNCSSDSEGADMSSVVQPSLNAMVVGPIKDQVVNGLTLPEPAGEPGSVELEIQVAANSSTPLRYLRLFFNMGWPNEVVQTIDYSEGDNKLRVLETFVVTIASEGEYTLDVQATNYPIGPLHDADQIKFTLDMSQPTGEILTDVFTEEEAYSLGSGLMRLHGWAYDPRGLSTVQVNVDDGPWQDVTLDEDGSWRTAVYIGEDKYGQNVDVKMRAFDWSGNSTIIAKAIPVDIESPVVPWTELGAESVTVREDDGLVELAVYLSAAATQTVTVQYATSPGTALAISDYTPKSGTITFNPGVKLRTISIPIADDDEAEDPESFTITLSAPSGATLGTVSVATITITDDDGGGYSVFLPAIVK